MTLGGAIGFLSSPLVGRALGGLLAGLIGGAIEARTLRSTEGKRLRFAAAEREEAADRQHADVGVARVVGARVMQMT